MQPPTLQDVYRARQVISRYLTPTPLVRSAAMSEALECEVYLKLETVQPIGVFKARGGINLISQLSEDERARGVITASTGNHGQSIAYAAKTFGVVLVSEEEMRQGVRFLLEAAHQLAEPAGAAPAAAARKLKERLRGQTVVLIVSGCNITLDQLRRVLTDPQPW